MLSYVDLINFNLWFENYLNHIDGIMAVIGFWEVDGVMTTPLFGYDTDAPAELGLYRMASWMVSISGKELNLLVNASGGVGAFKRQRGAVTVRLKLL